MNKKMELNKDSKEIEKLLKCPPITPKQRVIWEVFFLSTMLFAVAIFGNPAKTDVKYTWILTGIFVINLSIRFLTINMKGDWFFFLFGVICGGGNDLLSMINGVYNYTSITIFRRIC